MGRSRLLSRRRKRKAAEAEAALAAATAEAELEASEDMISEGGHVEPEAVAVSGETDLSRLLDGLAPELDPVVYTYANLEKADQFIGLFPLMLFNEAEGVTGIVPLEKAETAGVSHQYECRRITLTIHSALHAVGLISTVAEALEDADIPCNVVSAFHHDHIFVPVGREEEALSVLQTIGK